MANAQIRPVSSALFLKVWFAWIWRMFMWFALVIALIVLALAVLPVAFDAVGVDKKTLAQFLDPLSVVIAVFGGFWASFKAFRQIIGRNFEGVRLAFIDAQAKASVLIHDYGNGSGR